MKIILVFSLLIALCVGCSPAPTNEPTEWLKPYLVEASDAPSSSAGSVLPLSTLAYSVIPDRISATNVVISEIADESCAGKVFGNDAVKISYTLTIVFKSPEGEDKEITFELEGADCTKESNETSVSHDGFRLQTILSFIKNQGKRGGYRVHVVDGIFKYLSYGEPESKSSTNNDGITIKYAQRPTIVFMQGASPGTDNQIFETISDEGWRKLSELFKYSSGTISER